MALSEILLKRAGKTAEQRKTRYGRTPPEHILRLLSDDRSKRGFFAGIRLLIYILFGSPKDALALVYRSFTDKDTPEKTRKIDQTAEALKARLSSEACIYKGYFERRIFSRDLARIPSVLEKLLHRTTPLIVAQPAVKNDILSILRFAKEEKLPLFPRGVSSSAFGGATPTMNGIVLDLSGMQKILDVDSEKKRIRVEPGARWADIAEALAPHGLALATTPTSRFSTVGGWLSTGGLGVNGYGRGHLKDWVKEADIALMNGETLRLSGQDDRLKDFIGAEGQQGIFTELTLEVTDAPKANLPILLYFDTPQQAVAFLQSLKKAVVKPVHAAFYDSARMREENTLFQASYNRDGDIVKAQNAVLLHFESEADFAAFQAEIPLGDFEANKLGAYYLWQSRFFPLKAQRLGPSMLASEAVLPLAGVVAFLKKAKRLSKRFGALLQIEAFISVVDGKETAVVIASFLCDRKKRLDYLLRLLLVQLLTYQSTKLGGRPYGFGIWNSPFLNRAFTSDERKRLMKAKRESDEENLLNPLKFFQTESRLFNIPGLLFSPRIHEASLAFVMLFSGLIGMVAKITKPAREKRWIMPSVHEKGGWLLLMETGDRCTSCGACVSICPAYRLTKNELVTARAKLRLAEALEMDEEVERSEALTPFQCFHCGLCEEVCQTSLPLVACYEALEERIEARYGDASWAKARFGELADENRALLLKTYGLKAAEWLPDPAKQIKAKLP